MAFGEILRNARLQRGLTPSDVAESTHLLVQVVTDLEREDFRRVAAPIYGRGFVKLYAEMLELDPEPLVRDFMSLYTGAQPPAIRTRVIEQPPVEEAEEQPQAESCSVTPPQRQSVVMRHLEVQEKVKSPKVTAQEKTPTPSPCVTSEAPKQKTLVKDKDLHESISALDERETPIVRDPFRLVVEPEPMLEEPQEPDLFHPAPLRQAPVSQSKDAETPSSKSILKRTKMRVLPVFKIGGRMSTEPLLTQSDDEEAHARRRARIQAFAEGFNRLREGVERKLPTTMPQKRLMLIAGAGVLALILLIGGIRTLFRLTDKPVAERPADLFELGAPPPPLYVD